MSKANVHVVVVNFRMLERAMNRCAESFRRILDLELKKFAGVRAGRGAEGTAARMTAVRRPRRSAAKRRR